MSIPLRMAGSCLGTCVAFSFFKMADTGTVRTMTAVRCVLAWLQVSGAMLAWTASSAPKGWIETACDRLALVGYGDVGVCSCRGDVEEELCFSDQFAFRAAASTMAVFLSLLVLALSGCAAGAARYHETGKFLALLVLWVVSLLAPNDAFSTFATVATVASGAFVLVQSIVILDMACSWHDWWFSHARGERKSAHEAAILSTAAAFLLGAITLAVLLWNATSPGIAHGVILAAEIVAFALLVLSITDWCEHGTLLTSSVMMLYNTWLAHQAMDNGCLAAEGGHPPQILPSWFGLALCAATVFFLSRGVSFEAEPTAPPASQQALLPATTGDVAAFRATSGLSDGDARNFIIQCAVHMVVPLYVASALAKKDAQSLSGSNAGQGGCGAFGVQVAVLFASQLLYGWHLVAPKVLKNRQF